MVHFVEVVVQSFRLESTDNAVDRLGHMSRELALLGLGRLLVEFFGKMDFDLHDAPVRAEAAKVIAFA